jgi:hypothetical protein
LGGWSAIIFIDSEIGEVNQNHKESRRRNKTAYEEASRRIEGEMAMETSVSQSGAEIWGYRETVHATGS